MHQKLKIEMISPMHTRTLCKILMIFQSRKFRKCMVTKLEMGCSKLGMQVPRIMRQIRSFMTMILMLRNLLQKEFTIKNGKYVMKLSRKSTNFSITNTRNLKKAKGILRPKTVMSLYYTVSRFMDHLFNK